MYNVGYICQKNRMFVRVPFYINVLFSYNKMDKMSKKIINKYILFFLIMCKLRLHDFLHFF